MEIGSFIELDLDAYGEYHNYDKQHIARLNSGRAGIYHACILFGVTTVYLPYYLCPSVRSFLQKKGISIIPYYIDETFVPQLNEQSPNSAIVIVNYFGILSNSYLEKVKSRYQHVIIDNCPSFFTPPPKDCMTVYSPRKFFGVPDGGYVVGKNAGMSTHKYKQDISSGTSSFLLQRIELGCSAVYAQRMKNEKRIDDSDMMNMSVLTKHLLSGINYEVIKQKRKNNFHIAHTLFKEINLIDPLQNIDDACVPMVYPLVIKDLTITDYLSEQNIYTGRWWKHVLKEVPDDAFESMLSKYMIPIPIDQRYDETHIRHVFNVITTLINK